MPPPMAAAVGGAAHGQPAATATIVALHDSTGLSVHTSHSQSAGASTSTATVATPAAATTATSRLADKLNLDRIAAMARDFYLANGEVVRRSTDWYREGRANNLVHRAAAQAAREAQAAHAADPGVMPSPEAPLRASLTIIGTIATDRCFIRADGNYRGPNPALPFLRPFSQTTLTCALAPPPADHPQLAADFVTGMATLRTILPREANERSGHVYQNISGQHLRLRHAVFAVSRTWNTCSDVT